MAEPNLFSSLEKIKRCSKCGAYATDFRHNRNMCVPCHKAYHRAYYKKNKPKFKHHSRTGHLRRTFGMTPDDYEAMLSAQDGLCAICLRHGRLHIDHCHRTGAVRGILCEACNQSLGKFQDDPVILDRAAAYLRKHQKQ